MLTIVFAARTSWIGLLIFLAALFAVWFVIKAFIDLAHWFREEIIEDFRDRRRNKDKGPKSRGQEGSSSSDSSSSEVG